MQQNHGMSASGNNLRIVYKQMLIAAGKEVSPWICRTEPRNTVGHLDVAHVQFAAVACLNRSSGEGVNLRRSH